MTKNAKIKDRVSPLSKGARGAAISRYHDTLLRILHTQGQGLQPRLSQTTQQACKRLLEGCLQGRRGNKQGAGQAGALCGECAFPCLLKRRGNALSVQARYACLRLVNSDLCQKRTIETHSTRKSKTPTRHAQEELKHYKYPSKLQ